MVIVHMCIAWRRNCFCVSSMLIKQLLIFSFYLDGACTVVIFILNYLIEFPTMFVDNVGFHVFRILL